MADENSATILRNGQLVVATVAQSGDLLTDPSVIDATAIVQTDNGPQKVVKTYNMGGGGGGGGTDDYTDLTNKPQINSITLTGNKTGDDLGLITNKATGTNSVSILNSNSKTGVVNIGKFSTAQTNYNTCIGTNCTTSGNNVSGVSPSYGASTVAVGYYAEANAGTAIGSATQATNGVAIGRGRSNASRITASGTGSIAIGFIASSSDNCSATAAGAIQIGNGQNSTANTVQFNSYQLLDANGKIPADRVANIVTLTTTSVQLASDNVYNGGELASVTLTLPSTVPANFCCQVQFSSGATPTTFSASGIYFDGDECSAGTFTPTASHRYSIMIYNDGVNTLGFVYEK